MGDWVPPPQYDVSESVSVKYQSTVRYVHTWERMLSVRSYDVQVLEVSNRRSKKNVVFGFGLMIKERTEHLIINFTIVNFKHGKRNLLHRVRKKSISRRCQL